MGQGWSGDMGWQRPRHPPPHQPIRSGSVGQGPAAVAVVPRDPLCTSVILQVLVELPLSTGCASTPFLCGHPHLTSQCGPRSASLAAASWGVQGPPVLSVSL